MKRATATEDGHPPRKRPERPDEIARLKATVAALQARVEALERLLGADRTGRAAARKVRLLRQRLPDVAAAVRVLEARPTPPDPGDLAAYAHKVLSQRGEDGIVYELFRRIGFTDRRSVELGCGSNGGNSGILVAGLGFTGLMVDGNEELVGILANKLRDFPITPRVAWITREAVDDLLAEHGFTGEIDFLGIDIDGNDYWVWEALTVARPRLVVLEYNFIFGPDLAVTIPYNPTFDRHEHKRYGAPWGYHGASLRALTRLSQRKGYRLVAVEPSGVNAFFLRDDVAPAIAALDPGTAWRPQSKGDRAALWQRVRDQGVREYFGPRAELVEVE